LNEHHTPALALEALGVEKAFGHPVLRGINLSLRRGEIYALLGRNGAGKTTLLRIIAGLAVPDRGTVKIDGLDTVDHAIAVRQRTAWLPDEPMVYDKLSPLEYLSFMAGLWRVPHEQAMRKAEELLVWLDLWERRDDRCEGFSRGMRQKVALAGALIHQPALILFDEPMTGLDVTSVMLMKQFLRRFADGGGTILLTTHLLDVAERIADRIGVIHGGMLVAEGTLEELRGRQTNRGETLEDVFTEITGAAA
jgi:ABC-2 type transport system ATP-binding protein